MKFIIIIATFLITDMASASYFRFWRGEIKSSVSYNTFQTGLNSIFVPVTGNLKTSIARLNSYHPFLVDEMMSKNENLPTEIALVEYESENSYQAFRATAEGKKYGDLHWDYFNKDNSKSLLPNSYVGQPIEFENAYVLSKLSNPTFFNGIPFFQIVKRASHLSDSQWRDCIFNHLGYLSTKKVESVIFLVTEEYVIEYSIWKSAKDKKESDNDYLVEVNDILVNKELTPGRLLHPNSGIRFQ